MKNYLLSSIRCFLSLLASGKNNALLQTLLYITVKLNKMFMTNNPVNCSVLSYCPNTLPTELF